MKLRVLSIGLIIVVTLACGAVAEEPRDLALARFEAAVPGVGIYSDDAGRITRVYGKPLQYGVSPEDSAGRFVADRAAVFGTVVEDLAAFSRLHEGGHTQQLMYDRE
ncbi:MAG: hypothetical protein ABII12_16620, partial [Planctomycetota bacterium]